LAGRCVSTQRPLLTATSSRSPSRKTGFCPSPLILRRISHRARVEHHGPLVGFEDDLRSALTHNPPRGVVPPRGYWARGLLEPCPARARAAFRNRKYFRTNCPSRATSGPLQIQHVVLRSTVSGPTFAVTTWYRALQFGQRKSGDLFGLGMSTRNILPRSAPRAFVRRAKQSW
jgi:hypothetical protein